MAGCAFQMNTTIPLLVSGRAKRAIGLLGRRLIAVLSLLVALAVFLRRSQCSQLDPLQNNVADGTVVATLAEPARRVRSAAIVFALMALASGIGAWVLLSNASRAPESPIAERYRLGGVGLLVDRPGVVAELSLSCAGSEIVGPRRWCGLSLAFAPSVKAGTRWAITFASGIEIEGRGTLLQGTSRFHGADLNEDVLIGLGSGVEPGVVAAQAIVGTVTSSGVSSTWHSVNNSAYLGSIPAVRYRRAISFGIRLSGEEAESVNGITAGSLPAIGHEPGTRYELLGYSPRYWQTPTATYNEATFSPNYENKLLGQLATEPGTVEPRTLVWSQRHPFQAHWTYTQPEQTSDARRALFLSGALISLSGGFLVALVQLVVRRRSGVKRFRRAS